MKRYLLKILVFFIAVSVLDMLFGYACQFMNDHSKGGGVRSRYYVCKESNEDVLIFGSSRAKHHYVPSIIEDSLGMTCYNAGEDGNGIILSYGFLKIITQRYSPKLIIYDVTQFDIYEDDNVKYLDLLKPYYHEPEIDSIFWKVNPKTRYMMLSNFYRFNTTCLRIAGGYMHPTTDYPKGYSALYKTMGYEPKNNSLEKKELKVDDLKMEFFENFIRLSQYKNISLVCCVSPYYKAPLNDLQYEPVKKLCQQYGIPFFHLAAELDISNNKEFFNDKTHMNDKGARYFTSILMKRVFNN